MADDKSAGAEWGYTGSEASFTVRLLEVNRSK